MPICNLYTKRIRELHCSSGISHTHTSPIPPHPFPLVHSFGHVLVGVWLTNPEAPATGITDATSAQMPPVSIATKGRNVMQITNWQVYDLVLDAALAGDGCGPTKLQVGGEWAWLLNQVAARYGIKDTYQKLAHVNWVVSSDIYTMTGPCLELLYSQLEVLKQSADTGSLLPREELMYNQTVQVWGGGR